MIYNEFALSEVNAIASPADAEACSWVHQVGCCSKCCEGLLLHRQGATHRDVTPLLLMNLEK
jgi:hypothetical protein